MNALRRAARVVADEGVAALLRRIGRKVLRDGPRPAAAAPAPDVPAEDRLAECRLRDAQTEYQRQVDEFRARTGALGHEGLEHYYWYHTIDLGGGLVTPGDYDFRGHVATFGFPDDMTGMRVLDVGSATGFFAFEFERRGAEVVSVELPSLADWDILAAERENVVRSLMAWLRAGSPEEAYHRHLGGPFQFCHAALGSRVKRCYSSVYDLSLEKLGGEKFDLVYAGDILLHLFSPLRALDVLAGLCRGSLVATIEVPFPGAAPHPLMLFRGNASAETDRRTWWMLSSGCVHDILARLGFRSASVVGRYSGVVRRAWMTYEREVIRATKD
jgi:tRNA (mo5U34)-methyltransferase